MKKASFFAMIVLFMGLMGYLSPKQAEAIIVVNSYANPFSLVGGEQAVQIHIVNVGDPTGLREGEACTVQVVFFSPDGRAITDGTSCPLMQTLTGMDILTCGFESDREDFEGRNTFFAQVTVMGPSRRACMVLVSGETYDMTSMVTDTHINFGLPLI